MPPSKSAFDDARSPAIANAGNTGSVERDRELNATIKQQNRAVDGLEARQQHDRHANGRYDHPRMARAMNAHHVHQHQRLAEQNDRELETIEARHAREQQSSGEQQRRHEAERRELEQRQRREAGR